MRPAIPELSSAPESQGPQAPDALPASDAPPSPPVYRDPVIAVGGAGDWIAWLRFLVTAARARLAGAAALVLGALLAGGVALALFGAIADEMAEGDT
ncbi:MAG: hypothetical protein M3442_10765, partial [Chloroflexota bacterium]|nr:hypothetical protein [Chloroflexota bacterium]